MNFNPVVSSKPMWVVILWPLCMFFGIGFICEFVLVGMLGGWAVNYIGIKNVLIFTAQTFLPGVILIVIALKLKRIKWQKKDK